MDTPTRVTRASKRKSLAEGDAAPPPKKQRPNSTKPTKKAATSKAKQKAKSRAKAPERAPTRSASSSPPSDPPPDLRSPSPFPGRAPGRPVAAPRHTTVVYAGTLSPAIQAAIAAAVREAIRSCLNLVGPMVNHTRQCARFAAGSLAIEDVNEQQERVFRTLVRVMQDLGGVPPNNGEETDEAEDLEEPSGREDGGEDGESGSGEREEQEEEGTRKPKKEGQKKKAPRRRSEAELLGPVPEVTSGKRICKASGAAKELRRTMDWDWPM